MEKKYIAVVEHNDHEGESFGYYVEDTKENREVFKELQSILEDNDLFGHGDGYSFELEPATPHELEFLEKGADNGYMPRVNYVSPNFDWSLVINDFKEKGQESDALYKGGILEMSEWQSTL